MTFTQHKSLVRTIHQGDPDFKIVDGFALVPRAMLHVLPECPLQVRTMVEHAMTKGYIKCIANVKDYELMIDRLSE